MKIRVLMCAVFLSLFTVFSRSTVAISANIPDKSEIAQRIKKIQVPFIVNQGQIQNEKVRFYANTFSGAVFVTKDGEIVYSLPEAKNPSPSGVEGVIKIKGVALKESMMGARAKGIIGLEESLTKVNYFRGSDPSKWKTDIATYDSISLGSIYEGIELKLKAYGNNVEKLFYVGPAANPSVIQVKLDGANSLRVNENGELEAETELGLVRFTKPVAYQEEHASVKPSAGVNRRYIEVAYIVEGNSYTFKLGDYDKTKELIIDPLLASTFVDGNSVIALAIDSSNNVFVGGVTGSPDFPTTEGAYDRTFNGADDVFVSKFNSSLSTLVAATYLGGSGSNFPHSLAIDSAGNVFVGGKTLSPDFPTTEGAYDRTFNGGCEYWYTGCDAFVSKFDNSLTMLLASTFLGEKVEYVYYKPAGFLIIDSSGNVFVTGATHSPDFPTTQDAYDRTFNGGNDAFVSKFNSTLTTLLASTYLGGSGSDYPFSLAIDSFGNVFAAGETNSPDFPTTEGAYDRTYGGCSYNSCDGFVSKFNNSLTTFLGSTFIGGSADEQALSLAIDSLGNVFAAGATYSPDFPTTEGAYDRYGPCCPWSGSGVADAFISKFDNSLTTLVASTFFGSHGVAWVRSLAIDSLDNVFVTGGTVASIPTTEGAYQMNPSSCYWCGGFYYFETFVSKFNNSLTTLLASTYLGGIVNEWTYSLAIDSFGNVFVAGSTNSPDFPTTEGAYDRAFGVGGGFVSKFTPDLLLEYVPYLLTVVKSGTGSGVVTSNPEGINCGEDCSEVYMSYTHVTLTATPMPGYIFTGWSGDSDCSDGIITMDADKTCTANFMARTHQCDGLRIWMSQPVTEQSGRIEEICGNSVGLKAEHAPGGCGVELVSFYAQPEGSAAWIEIGTTAKKNHYVKNWDTTSIAPGFYGLQAEAKTSDGRVLATSNPVTVKVIACSRNDGK